MSELATKQQLLVHEIRNEHEYDREIALRVWRTVQAVMPPEPYRNQGYVEHERMSDDDRIILLFEMLDGSFFGDMIFPDLANMSQGSTLIERGDDE